MVGDEAVTEGILRSDEKSPQVLIDEVYQKAL